MFLVEVMKFVSFFVNLVLRIIIILYRSFFVKVKFNKCRKFVFVVVDMDSRWFKRRVEYVGEVIVYVF